MSLRAVLDACVLYPTVLREILIGCAERDLFAPLWSPRLLEEWARTARRLGGAVDEALARGEIARLNARFPDAMCHHEDAAERAFWLPDPADIHVLATAVTARADMIVTLNLRDFPARELQGLRADAPDDLLRALWQVNPGAVETAVAATHARAEAMAAETLPLRALLKRARLPRLGKLLCA